MKGRYFSVIRMRGYLEMQRDCYEMNREILRQKLLPGGLGHRWIFLLATVPFYFGRRDQERLEDWMSDKAVTACGRKEGGFNC